MLLVLLVGDMMSCHQRDLPRAEQANAVYQRLQSMRRMEALEKSNKSLQAKLASSIRGKHVEAKFKDMEAEAEGAVNGYCNHHFKPLPQPASTMIS